MRFLKKLLGILPLRYAFGHCDIPCGMYDPTPLQIAAHTVVRMTSLLKELENKADGITREHTVNRLTRVKEDHAKKIEEELGTLRNDYFKDEHFDAHPNLRGLILETVMLSIKSRQTIDESLARDMVEKVLQISETFYKTKNVNPVRVKSLYPSGGEIVTYTT